MLSKIIMCVVLSRITIKASVHSPLRLRRQKRENAQKFLQIRFE